MPVGLPDRASLLSAIGSMNHLAFDVDPSEIEGFPTGSSRPASR